VLSVQVLSVETRTGSTTTTRSRNNNQAGGFGFGRRMLATLANIANPSVKVAVLRIHMALPLVLSRKDSSAASKGEDAREGLGVLLEGVLGEKGLRLEGIGTVGTMETACAYSTDVAGFVGLSSRLGVLVETGSLGRWLWGDWRVGIASTLVRFAGAEA